MQTKNLTLNLKPEQVEIMERALYEYSQKLENLTQVTPSSVYLDNKRISKSQRIIKEICQKFHDDLPF